MIVRSELQPRDLRQLGREQALLQREGDLVTLLERDLARGGLLPCRFEQARVADRHGRRGRDAHRRFGGLGVEGVRVRVLEAQAAGDLAVDQPDRDRERAARGVLAHDHAVAGEAGLTWPEPSRR